jgi:thiaminase
MREAWDACFEQSLSWMCMHVARMQLTSCMHACKGVGCILAAMTPCARLYGFLGLALAAAFPNARHAYSDWIATYSGRPYLSVPDAQEALLDEIGDQGNYGALFSDYFPPAMLARAGCFCNRKGRRALEGGVLL